MFEYLLFCVLVGNVVATSILWLHHNALKKVAIKTIQDKRMELLEHREKMRGDILEICESMWTNPQEWILTYNGAMHRSGLTIATIGTDSVYIRSPLPDQNLNPHEQREVLQALRHIQATQMRSFLSGECAAPMLGSHDDVATQVAQLEAPPRRDDPTPPAGVNPLSARV